ncbi:MAG: acetyltransferase [Gammaproteobacteria bacterium]|nr:acetyltransferase [Gammaproteobacteria bacterium]
MFLKERATGDLVEILGFKDLVDPSNERVIGRYHHGEETQDPEKFAKRDLVFPSGEALPACWTNPGYRRAEIQRRPRG